jgi:hypothetical protein
VTVASAGFNGVLQIVLPFTFGFVYIGFEVDASTAIGAEEIRIALAIKNGAYAFVMPDVGAWSNKEGLAWLNSQQWSQCK